MQRLLLSTLVALTLAIPGARAAERLPALGVATERTSVSGISSGAYMAGQFQLAFSADVVGAGIVAGGPWGCAAGGWGLLRRLPFGGTVNISRAFYRCMATSAGVPDATTLAERAFALAREGRIDPIENLRDDRVYLFHGEADNVVARPVVLAAAAFYQSLGVPPSALRTVLRLPDGRAGHGFIVDRGGSACDANASPFLATCGYDQAGEILAWIYPDLQWSPSEPQGRFIVFDQTEFLKNADAGLAQEGVAFVPPGCREAPGCRVHIVFHGCLQSRTDPTIGDRFVEGSGFQRHADANRLVILFPQTDAETAPNGCWDWWGYTGSDFLSQRAPQLAAVRAMLDRLGERP